jgi:uncharacterized protein
MRLDTTSTHGGFLMSNRKGFASMDPDLRKTISSKGGVAAHAQGRAHEFTSTEAIAAGRKGGLATRDKKRKQMELPFKAWENDTIGEEDKT